MFWKLGFVCLLCVWSWGSFPVTAGSPGFHSTRVVAIPRRILHPGWGHFRLWKIDCTPVTPLAPHPQCPFSLCSASGTGRAGVLMSPCQSHRIQQQGPSRRGGECGAPCAMLPSQVRGQTENLPDCTGHFSVPTDVPGPSTGERLPFRG